MRYILLLATILFFSIGTYAQSEAPITAKQIQKQRKANAKAAKRAHKYGKARHMSIQDKATRQRMKKNVRESNKRNKALRRR